MNTKPEEIIKSVVIFLRKELNRDTLDSESKEGVEVAIECLCKAYDIPDSINSESVVNLESLFEAHSKDEIALWYSSINFSPSEEAKAEAEKYKNLGNAAMQQDKPEQAVIEYSKAIECDRSNPVYYCNRAASNNKLKNYELALKDCSIAIKIDPSYAKAYGRMGLAYTQMNNFKAALEAYTKAAQLDPNDPLYTNNMQAAMSNLNNSSSSSSSSNGATAGAGSNAFLEEISNKMLSNPSVQQMFGQLMAGIAPNQQMPNTGSQSQSPQQPQTQSNAGIQALLNASQQIAAQLEERNPQLVDQILQQFGPVLNNVRSNPNISRPGDGSTDSQQ